MNILVAGAGGAIGGHLVKALLEQGHEVKAADIKPLTEWWQLHEGAYNFGTADMRYSSIRGLMAGVEHVYDLAELMGGIGFITANKVDCAESIEIGISVLRAAVASGVRRVFFSSSACVYPMHLQTSKALLMASQGLGEEDAWPAEPEEGYGFSKLYMEELMRYYRDEKGLEIRIARYHNVFGDPGSWNDGREKAPAALCRKVAVAARTGKPVVIWGNGKQLRSYLHVSDCVRGTLALMESNYDEPVNIGSDQSISVDDLVSVIEEIAGVTVERHYDLSGAQGVSARNADISLAREVLGWEPVVPLRDGLGSLYAWIEEQVSTVSPPG